MKKFLFTLLVAVGLSMPVMGQDLAKEDSLSFRANTDFTTHYFHRGINQEDAGVIAQPSLDVVYHAHNNLRVNGVWWNSIHEAQTRASVNNDVEAWYETRLGISVDFDLTNFLTTSFGYNLYLSPNAAFDEIQEITLGVSSNKEFFGVDVNPYVLLAFETEGSRDGNGTGSYLELGIRPTVIILDNITVSTPVVVGFSIDDYYGDDADFGYLDIGLEGSIPLEFIGDNWTLNAGVHGLFLGGDADNFNNNSDFELVGNVGVSMSF